MTILDTLRTALAGRYEVEREIGAGGMATVYLARDLKHERQVAVKVLNPELGAVLGVERFLAEIRVTANLQHPNLLPLFDSGDAQGHLYYVMPFVEGESLRARLDREQQLPVEEAVRVATAIGNALSYAHQHGVIHRDLKPENILLQHGQPVIADFGIALAISKAGGSRVTQTGLSLGTPQYMSPEQAAGDRVLDGRSDIYSLGAMLYEMLSGEPPHVGQSVQAIIAKVLTDKPRALRLSRDTVPVHVELAVDKALAKLPADRFADAASFVRALQGDGLASMPSGVVSMRHGGHAVPWYRQTTTRVMGVVTVAALAVAGTSWMKRGGGSAADERLVRFPLVPQDGAGVRTQLGALAAISPDGKMLVYIGQGGVSGQQLWVRPIDDENARPLTGTVDVADPAFTPDNKFVVYANPVAKTCLKIGVDGGAPQPLFDNCASHFAWVTSDSAIFDTERGFHLLLGSLKGGTPIPFLKDDRGEASAYQRFPQLAEDGKTVFFVSSKQATGTRTFIAWADRTERVAHQTDISVGALVGWHGGRLYALSDDGRLLAYSFDLKTHTLMGSPTTLNEQIDQDQYGAKAFLSPRGDLVYLAGSRAVFPKLVAKSGGRRLLEAGRAFDFPRYSPDGSRVAFSITEAGRTDVWVLDLRSGALDRLTTEGTDNQRPEWSPDGKHVLYRSDAFGDNSIVWRAADGSGKAERLSPPVDGPAMEGVITPDGKTLVFRIDSPQKARDILSVPLSGEQTVTSVLATPFDELTPRISPDGKWMVYVSNESGRDEIYVRPFPGPGGRVLISQGGGATPLWTRDGKGVYYQLDDGLELAKLSLSPEVSVVSRDRIDVGPFAKRRFHAGFDVAPNDAGVLVLETGARELRPIVALNWGAAMRAKLGPPK